MRRNSIGSIFRDSSYRQLKAIGRDVGKQPRSVSELNENLARSATNDASDNLADEHLRALSEYRDS